MAVQQRGGTVGMWPWFLQRVTGLALLFFLGVHMYVTHFGGVGILTFSDVAGRFHSSPNFWTWFDGLFLIIAVFHGLNGVRTIIYDFRPNPIAKILTNISLWIIGLATAIGGLIILAPYTRSGAG